MAHEGKFDFESMQDAEGVQTFLAALAEGFAKGKVTLRSEDEEINLAPSPLMTFSVKAKRKDGESKLSVKVAWKDSRGNIAAAERSIKVEG